MKFDFHSQLLISQLEKIYTAVELFTGPDGKWDGHMNKHYVSKPLLFNELYDLMKDDINFAPAVKNELWKFAQESFVVNEKRRPEEKDQELLHKYYKSFLICRYCMEKLPERLKLYNEDGKEIKRITLYLK